MKRKLFTLAVLLVWVGLANAGEIVVKLPADEYRANQKKLEDLQRKVDRLEQKVNATKTQAAPAAKKPAAQEMDSSKLRKINKSISDIYDTLDEVETKALLDRVNFGAELRVRMDDYRVRNYQPMTLNSSNVWVAGTYINDERNDANWSSRFRLNLESEVSKSITFHARLALAKNWADSTASYSDDTSAAQRNTGDTNLKVDRFYIDWVPEFIVPIAFTIGRQPTTDGSPFEFKEDRERDSTYPALIFDGEPDGIVVTLGLDRYTGLKNSGLRYFYAMAHQHDNDTQFYLDGVSNDAMKDTRVHGVFFETEVPGFRDSLFLLSFVPASDIGVMNPNGVGANLGDISVYGAHLQFSDFMSSGFDFFVSYGENRNAPDSATVTMGTGSSASDPMLNMGLFQTAATANGADMGHTTGRAYYVGLRYEIPLRALNLPKVGFEYNHGSQYWFSFTPGPAEVYNKLATRGEVFDYYYIQPLNKNMTLRTGYTQIEYDYSGSTMPIGTPTDYETDGNPGKPKFDNFYILLDTKF